MKKIYKGKKVNLIIYIYFSINLLDILILRLNICIAKLASLVFLQPIPRRGGRDWRTVAPRSVRPMSLWYCVFQGELEIYYVYFLEINWGWKGKRLALGLSWISVTCLFMPIQPDYWNLSPFQINECYVFYNATSRKSVWYLVHTYIIKSYLSN